MSRWWKEFQRKRPLSDAELLEMVNNPLDSEDEFEFEDSGEEDDPTVFPNDLIESSSDEDSITEEAPDNSENMAENPVPPDSNPTNVATSSSSLMTENVSESSKKVIWKSSNLKFPEKDKAFLGDTSLNADILGLDSPYQFFKFFCDDTLLETIAEESTLYSAQRNPNKPESIKKEDIQKFLGICVFTSVSYCTNVRDYWADVTGSTFVKEVMAVNSFEKLRANLHFNNNETQVPADQPGFDKLHKIRPIINRLQEKFLLVPIEESLSVDEQICATKLRHHLKQYMANKPHKWGFKLFFLCGVSGYAYAFEVYTGQENNPNERPRNEPDFGASSNVVVRLARNVPNFKHHKIYFDNYFTSLPLLVYLHNRGIFSLGTVRRNRIPNCKLPTDQQLKKEPRGKSVEFVGNVDGVDVACLSWKDNKTVNLMSTFSGQQPETTVRRFDQKNKVYKEVKCPEIITIYNKHMGGVDLFNSHIGRHKIKMRSKKWYFRLFYHLVDVAIVNAWLLYKRVCLEKNIKPVNQKSFRIEVAQTLCTIGRNSIKRGRPSSSDIQGALEVKKRRNPATVVPPVDVRKDAIDHWPEWVGRGRCKNPTCKNLTFVSCVKCKLHLCFNQKSYCFRIFHLK